ncbi:MAG: hypothetical protein DM484_02450 [Candidatus Methylumidiphilus alinenensis]|uniref:Uncharacterized protein n=1 Tax=Candidatus Methylumidiphilus alinenensis TaxID=2202197 RepID=A0A2W4RZG7_9GAMM|nr:MAG: hypothetical protein DM484_02450 [Candidatus Methylumidiphilus alinenensis]
MGKKTKLQGSPAFALPHAAGATIVPFQTLTHETFGAIGYSWSEFWIYEAELAQDSYEKLKALHQAVLVIEPHANGIRSIHDKELLKALYEAGTGLVSHATRSVQHLVEAMARQIKTPLVETTATERIREACRDLGLDDYSSTDGYQGFAEMLSIRDAVEHPTQARIFTGDPSKWDQVPLAWSISERSIKAYERYADWFDLLTRDFDAYLSTVSKPEILSVRARGLMSPMSVKKPPRT